MAVGDDDFENFGSCFYDRVVLVLESVLSSGKSVGDSAE